MDPATYLADVRTEGARLGAAARAAGLRAPVPTCAGWTVADLLVHTAKVFRQRTHVLTHRLRERPAGADWQRDVPAPDAVADWYDEELAALVAALDGIDPSTPVWTFVPHDATAAFWFRRMAHEAVVHRVDAEAAAGIAPGPVRTELALDGVDEVLDVFLAAAPGPAGDGPPATVHLHATDGEGEWLVTLGPDGVTVDRGHAKGDAALRGPAAALLLWLWGRAPATGLERFGDEGAVVRLRAAAAAAT